jgi:rubredoxin
MSDDELQGYCPECAGEQTFWLTARTELELGRKRKYSCSECDYGFVRIDGTVDTSVEA